MLMPRAENQVVPQGPRADAVGQCRTEFADGRCRAQEQRFLLDGAYEAVGPLQAVLSNEAVDIL